MSKNEDSPNLLVTFLSSKSIIFFCTKKMDRKTVIIMCIIYQTVNEKNSPFIKGVKENWKIVSNFYGLLRISEL